MVFHHFNGSRREQLQIWITVWIMIVLSGFRVFVEIQPRIDSFFAAYTAFPVAVVTLNILFFWLLFLLWVAYRQWHLSIKSEKELERVLKSISPDALLVINRDREITMCSGQIQSMFGFSEYDLVGQKTDTLYFDRRLHGTKGEIAARLESVGFHVGYATGKRRDGKTFPLEVVTGTIPLREGAVILLRDITERRRMEDALRESEIRFEQFMRFFPGFAFIKDRHGRRIYLNDAHATERGWDIDACLGCKDEDLYREDLARQFRESDMRVLSENKALRYVIRTEDQNGQPKSLLTVKFPLPSTTESDSDSMIAGLSLDITEQEAAERERMKIEKQMQQAQKLESLGVLAGGIAHDFNNLIMGMVGHADLALASGSDIGKVRSHVESVLASCQRAADLANQLLAYSGKGQFVLAPAEINHIVKDLQDLLKVSISKKAVVQFELLDSLPAIECDITQIHQVLMNLIVNASDALEGQPGVITLQTGKMRIEEDDPVSLVGGLEGQQTLAPGDYVFVRVSDTGTGITKADQQKIFDPFFTTKKTGHGLGLASVLGIIRSHGGGISVDSKVGKGTSCCVYLPVSQHEAPVSAPSPVSQKKWHGEGKVLLADDEDMVREVAKVMLESLGFAVVEASNGREALELFHANPSSVCALVLDVTMPELSGVEVCRELRGEGIKTPIVLSSGYNQNEGTDEFPAGDNVIFLKKPYRLEVLRGTMFDILQHQ